MDMLASNDWHEQIKQTIQQAANQRLYVCEGTISSRQLNPPSVKVMLQPFSIETGWIRVGTPYAGNGFGFLAIPPDQMSVKVIFDLGDINNPTLVCNVYNDVDLPPALTNVDDVVLQHKSGAKIYITSSGEVDISSASGQNVVFNGGTEPVARQNDTVEVIFPAGMSWSQLSAGTTLYGNITSGSSDVKA